MKRAKCRKHHELAERASGGEGSDANWVLASYPETSVIE